VFLAPQSGAETLLEAATDPAIAASAAGAYVVWSSSNGVRARVPGKSEPVLLSSEGAFAQVVAVPGGPVLAAWESKGQIEIQTLGR
ncbi:MAG: hypothetical protein HYR60_33170, partial [Acidobacteria bacterium]|nr:hypothetical protein [Acidobacteriota bacterium]